VIGETVSLEIRWEILSDISYCSASEGYNYDTGSTFRWEMLVFWSGE
jgi:hypothetical protein